jgi:hypothetical protein
VSQEPANGAAPAAATSPPASAPAAGPPAASAGPGARLPWPLRVETLTGKLVFEVPLYGPVPPSFDECLAEAQARVMEYVLEDVVRAGQRLKLMQKRDRAWKWQVFAVPDVTPELLEEWVNEAMGEIPEWATNFQSDAEDKYPEIVEWAKDNNRVTEKMVLSVGGLRRAVDKLIEKDEERSWRRR